MTQEALFRSKTGALMPGLTKAAYGSLWRELLSDWSILTTQVVESASYSMAMVVRYALGLSATGGKVCALVADSLAGWTALATLRHLSNAGAQGIVIIAAEQSSAELILQLAPLKKMGIECARLSELSAEELSQIFTSCHNVICGFYALQAQFGPQADGVVSILNELRTPVHCLEAPLGMDVDSGRSLGAPLFASSTLSLGAPLIGLYYGNDYVGRHYLCDISIPPALYAKYTADLSPLFAEQPVVQIFPGQDKPAEDQSGKE